MSDLFQENLKSLARRLGLWLSWMFQQDKDPNHASKLVKNQTGTEVL